MRRNAVAPLRATEPQPACNIAERLRHWASRLGFAFHLFQFSGWARFHCSAVGVPIWLGRMWDKAWANWNPGCRCSTPNATILVSMKRENPNRPRVGIPWRTHEEEEKGITKKLDYYLRSVRVADAEPQALSLGLTGDQLSRQIRDVDAFVLPGAPVDVNPSLYRAARHQKTHEADPDRERTDFTILEHAFASGKPVLAICYGCQSLNVCLGGSLYQDIASELHTEIQHSKENLPSEASDPVHAARIKPGGELGQLAAVTGLQNSAGAFDAVVNTSHHQSIRDLGRGLRVAALAPDGVIEAVEHEPHKHWVVGVQWHPERLAGDALATMLFSSLVQAARAAAVHR